MEPDYFFVKADKFVGGVTLGTMCRAAGEVRHFDTASAVHAFARKGRIDFRRFTKPTIVARVKGQVHFST